MTELEKMEMELSTYSTDERVTFVINYKVSDWIKLTAALADKREEMEEKGRSTYIYDYMINKVKNRLEIDDKRFENYRKNI